MISLFMVGQILAYIFAILSIIFIHELGHIFFYNIYGKKPKIIFKWWGVQCGDINDSFDLTIKQNCDIILGGVFAGLIPLFIAFHFQILPLQMYLFACVFDFISLFNLLSIEHKYFRKKYYEFVNDVLINFYEKRSVK